MLCLFPLGYTINRGRAIHVQAWTRLQVSRRLRHVDIKTISVTPRPLFTPGKTRYPLYTRLGGPQGRSGQVRQISSPTGIRSPDHPVRSQSLYRILYPALLLLSGAHHIFHVSRLRVKKSTLCLTLNTLNLSFLIIFSVKNHNEYIDTLFMQM